MKSRIVSLFVMLAFVLTFGISSSFAQDTTKAKAKHKAKVVKVEKKAATADTAKTAKKAVKAHKKAAKTTKTEETAK
ncbi:MAG: hypothetical protein P4L45_14635 [Ignavibacteriaceae bacterium]|nr:hypothetical protein [Ignavibacteriaceae bacterium]